MACWNSVRLEAGGSRKATIVGPLWKSALALDQLGTRGKGKRQPDVSDSALVNTLAAYPELAKRQAPADSRRQVSLVGELLSRNAIARVEVNSEPLPYVLRRVGATLCGVTYVYPALDETQLQTHPLLLWWEVLYALSRLARYQPREWTELIDVSRSPDAAPIESGLAYAIDFLPEIALDALARAVDEPV